MIALDNNNYNLERDIKIIEKNTYNMNEYLTALTQISSLTYLTSLSTLTAYATEINEIENSIYSLTTDLGNYLLSSETSSLTFNSSVLSLSDYLKSSDTGAFTSPWDTISTSTLNNYLLSSETSSLTFNPSVLSLSDYVKTSDTGAFTSPWDTISTSTLNNYLLSSNYVSFDSSVLSSYLLSSDYVSFDSSVLSSYLLSSETSSLTFDTTVLNSYLLSSKTTDFAGSSIATLSTLSSLSSLTYLTSLSNTPYMIDAHITDTNSYLYNVSRMTNFNPGTIMGNYSMGYVEEKEINSNWMNSYDHLLSLDNMNNCLFHFEYYDTVYGWLNSNRRIGFSGRSLYNNTFETLSTLSAFILSSNKISRIYNIEADFAYSNTFWGINNMNVQRLVSNTFSSYISNISFISASDNHFSYVNNIQGNIAESNTFNACNSIALHYSANKCSFTNVINNLYINSAKSCSGYVHNCTINYATQNYLTARSFTIGTANNCTFQTCDSITFNELLYAQLWAPHYLKGGTISSGSVTGDNLVIDVGYIDGLYIGNVCRGTISFTSMGRAFTIASAGYPQDIVISYNLHPYRWASYTYYFSLSADLQSSFTLHIYNIENIRPSFQSAFISQFLCLDVLGPRGVFSNGSYSYASLAQYCPTSRLSYNGIPWAAILH